MTKTADASAHGSRRKLATQQNNSSNNPPQKKGNKQNHQNNSKPSAPTPASKPASPPVPQPEKHVPLRGFNAEEIDNLMSIGIDAEAEVYKPAKTVAQEAGPWGQKRKLHSLSLICYQIADKC